MNTPIIPHSPLLFRYRIKSRPYHRNFLCHPEIFISILWHQPNVVSSSQQLKRHNSGIILEHFIQLIDCQRVGMGDMVNATPNRGKFCSQNRKNGTKHRSMGTKTAAMGTVYNTIGKMQDGLIVKLNSFAP